VLKKTVKNSLKMAQTNAERRRCSKAISILIVCNMCCQAQSDVMDVVYARLAYEGQNLEDHRICPYALMMLIGPCSDDTPPLRRDFSCKTQLQVW